MTVYASEFLYGKHTPYNSPQNALLLLLTLIFFAMVPFYFLKITPSPLLYLEDNNTVSIMSSCDMFKGRWVPYHEGPYYTNVTCRWIIDQQNCLKFGRPDTDYLKWRWKPDDCELPLFDAVHFMEIVREKSMAFVGDSLARNQMESLLCLLTNVSNPIDVSYKYPANKLSYHWLYAEYNFSISTFWSPYLVKANDTNTSHRSYTSLMNLHLDKADDAWAAQIEGFDYVIISAGQWFFRPGMFYEDGKLVGCHKCLKDNITELPKFYAYRKAFQTAFKTLQNLKNYEGITLLRTLSPDHYENGIWNDGGNCIRTRPFTRQEVYVYPDNLEFYRTQVDEYRNAKRRGRDRGLKFRLLNTTDAMLLRPDGHPNKYGHWQHQNITFNDCVHWCLPGPIDTWNEFLLQILKIEHESSSVDKF
ncbi:Trichome birefringence-like, N-terminal domain [Dillenia turbinata]|uniref:Trichome birefringence-like, N-terminal domain n=1 Tax=Dillenia turbinata TaxID=194707 RepID=A0AAN8YV15_9MAGN